MTDKYSDQIFDYFVEELVSERRPPDLTERIVGAWRGEMGERGSTNGPQRMVAATVPRKRIQESRAQENRAQDALVPNGPLQAARLQDKHAIATGVRPRCVGNGVSHSRNFVAVLLAIGACGLLAILSWQFSQKSTSPTVAVDPSVAVDDSSEPRVDLLVLDKDLPVRPEADEESIHFSGAPEVLNIDDLPFSLDNSPEQPSDSIDRPMQLFERIASSEIISQIDQRLKNIWRELEVTPTEKLSQEQLARKISLALTAQQLPIENPRGVTNIQELVGERVHSAAFARLWSDNFVRSWFTRASLPIDDASVVELKREIASHIRGNQPWNEVAVKLLGGAIDDQNPSSTTTFVRALAGNGNHRLVGRIGMNFLDSNMACVRCHDASHHDASQKGRQSATDRQDVYWSLIALLQGVEASGNAGRDERVAIDRQAGLLAAGKPQLAYFDLLDGRLQAAEPKLPSGESWEAIPEARVPREALAKWISQSQLMDEATVNHTWKIVFGRPLVPQILAQQPTVTDSLSRQKWIELQELLAQQFRAHNHDLKLLVSWIVQCDAFARQPLDYRRTRWLEASEDELTKMRLTELAFAAFPTQQLGPESATLEGSLLAVLEWTDEAGFSSSAAGSATLAQPTPTSSAAKKPKQQKRQPATQAEPSMPMLAYALHGERHTAEELAFVNQLLKSTRLSWEDRVEHIVGLNVSNSASGRVKHLADELLRRHGGNAQAALLDLLWAVQSSDAIR